MKVAIVSNIANGKGLERDYRILRRLLEDWGHTVTGYQFDRDAPGPAGSADLLVFLEVIEPRFYDVAPRRWLIPNPEWFDPAKAAYVADFEMIGCKTADALRLFEPMFPGRARLIGFESEDRAIPNARHERRFLHAPGGSIVKGTQAIIDAWHRFGIRWPLTIVSSVRWPRRGGRVEHLGRLPDDRFKRLQNECGFHLCPSEYEGWGHYLHEGLSVGAAIVTTDAPPMNELRGVVYSIPPAARGTLRLATTAKVSPEGVREYVEKVAGKADYELDFISRVAREQFETERAAFRRALREVVG